MVAVICRINRKRSKKQLRNMLAKWLIKTGSVPTRQEAPIPSGSSGDAEAAPAGTVSASPAVSPLIATEYLDNIRALQQPDSPDLLGELIETYFTSSARLLESLRRAVGTGDTQGVFKAAHSLKSSSAILGALSLAERFKNLETLGRSNTTAGAAELLIKIESEYVAVCDTLALICKERTTEQEKQLTAPMVS